MKSWALETWGSCTHKKIVAAAAAVIALWNLTSIKTRIFDAFLCLVILRYRRQHSEVTTEEKQQHSEAAMVVKEESIPKSLGLYDGGVPWMEYALQQTHIAQKTIESTVENAIEVTSTHEDIVVGKIKGGSHIASFMTAGIVLGVGFLGLKKTRQFLSYKTLHLFLSVEVSRADAIVKKLQRNQKQVEESPCFLQSTNIECNVGPVCRGCRPSTSFDQITVMCQNLWKLLEYRHVKKGGRFCWEVLVEWKLLLTKDEIWELLDVTKERFTKFVLEDKDNLEGSGNDANEGREYEVRGKWHKVELWNRNFWNYYCNSG
ncbi:hypothetical protein ACS0TY_008302 [Phlomoides rotata]